MTTRMGQAVLVAALLAGAPALAQTPAAPTALAGRFLDPENGLSLDQALALALEQEPSLRAVRGRIAVAEGMRTQASLKPNPTVSFDQREEPGGMHNQTTVAVQWPLDLFRKESRVAVAEREIAMTRFAAADRERLTAADVRSRYGDLAGAVRDLEVLDEVVDATRRQHEVLRSRTDEGAAPPLERDLLDVELRRLESDRLLQDARAEEASFELKRALGLAADAGLLLRDTLESLVARDPATASPVPGVPSSPDRRADVQEAAARLAVAEAQVDRAEDHGRFDVSLFGNWMRMEAGFPQRALDANGALTGIRGRFHYVSVGAMVMLPLRDRNQGAVAAARAERAVAAATHEAAVLTAQAELAAARARHERAQRAVRVYADGARTLARRNLDVVRQSYELGRLTVFDVMSEQRRYLDVERAYTQALREAYEARVALDRARGERP